MSKQAGQSPKGARFEELCRLRGIPNSAFYTEIDGPSKQMVSNWKKRGVSPTYAVPVAAILKCDPVEIANIAMSSSSPVDPNTARERARTEMLRRLESATERMSQQDLDRLNDVLQALLRQ